MDKIVKEHGTAGDRISEKFRKTCAFVESRDALFFLSSSVENFLAATDILARDIGLLYSRISSLQVVFY